ncbi:hypothetical protein QN391_25890, partial [Pseudomonas sp. CCI1.2]|uniref:hypothetical protein n=1 Tax=Pseudomonas sp. CCI1.2 TaxID=3048614 RepID=UPI002B236C33
GHALSFGREVGLILGNRVFDGMGVIVGASGVRCFCLVGGRLLLYSFFFNLWGGYWGYIVS